MMRRVKDGKEPELGNTFSQSSEEDSDDSEPEIDEPDKAQNIERVRRDLISSAFPTTSGLVLN